MAQKTAANAAVGMENREASRLLRSMCCRLNAMPSRSMGPFPRVVDLAGGCVSDRFPLAAWCPAASDCGQDNTLLRLLSTSVGPPHRAGCPLPGKLRTQHPASRLACGGQTAPVPVGIGW